MELVSGIEKRLESVSKNHFLLLPVIVILGFVIRVYFTPWGVPPASPDTFVFLVEGLSYSSGDFQHFNPRPLWPLFLSMFFGFFQFSDYLDYVNVMRMISIVVSVSSIPIIYLIAKQFLDKRYAIVAPALFAIESNIIENSSLAISEPLFIFLGLISFYFINQRKESLMLIGFIFAGLAFDTRLNGIVLFFVLIISLMLKIRPKKKLFVFICLGILIFIAFSIPHIPLDNKGILSLNQISNVTKDASAGNKISPHIYDLERSVFGGQRTTLLDENGIGDKQFTTFDIYKNAVIKEILHLFRIHLPFLIIFAPLGLVISLKSLELRYITLYTVIAVSLIIAIPQYTQSAEYRNLIFLIPFLCILSSLAISKLSDSLDIKNIVLLLLFCGLIVLSFSFLREKTDVDIELIMEKESIGKLIATEYTGKFLGDNYNYIFHNISDVSKRPIVMNTNEKITLVYNFYTIDSIKELNNFIKEQKISHLVIDSEYDNRYPIFQDIFYDEEKYPMLEKIFDSKENGYKKYHVKIFRINY